MPGPWDKYAKATDSAPQSDGPWAKYGASSQTLPTATVTPDLTRQFWEATKAGDEPTKKALYQQITSSGGHIGAPPEDLDMSSGALGTDAQNYAASMGQSVYSTGRGLAQAGLDIAKRSLSGEGAVSAALGRPDTLGDAVGNAYEQSKKDETAARNIDAPLLHTKAGLAGNVTGYALQMALPAAALRGTAVGSALAPQTVRGMAAQGGVLGAIQPLGEGEGEGTRLKNAATGTAAGGLGAAAPLIAGNVARFAKGVVQPFTRSGQEQIAAQAIRGSATNPAALGNIAPSPIQGVRRSLAEEVLDPGVAQLQRQYPAEIANQQATNNAARTQAIRTTFNGADQAAQDASKSNANLTAIPLLKAAQTSGAQVHTEPVIQLAEKLFQNAKGNPAAQSTIATIKNELTGENGPVRDVSQLYNTRKFIDDLLAGRAGGETNAAKTAKVELTRIKSLLDRQIATASPDFAKYLTAYKTAMKPGNQAAVGEELLTRGGSVADPSTGERNLTPASFSKATNDMDALAANATGFKRAKADTTLTQDQKNVIASVRDDLQRLNYANNAGRAVGSNTRQNLATNNAMGRLVGNSTLGNGLLGLEPTQRLLSIVDRAYKIFGVPERLHETIAQALANPTYARSIISKLPTTDRTAAERVISRLAGPGTVIATKASQQ